MRIQELMLPKIGSVGLAIPQELHSKDWEFHPRVATYMRRKGINWSWFQCFNSDGWVWFHGTVALKDGKAVIEQVG
jgi:hypothetical protein